MENLFQELSLTISEPLSLFSLVLNLSTGVVISLLLKWHFKKFSSTLSNREEFGSVFPLILLTTVLIITVVKSSLALSLGLVGALSIVRFRTPIKEPEELAYLFVTIAVGLGLGANQTAVTIISTIIILAFFALIKIRTKTNPARNIFLSIDLENRDNSKGILESVTSIIDECSFSCDLRRFDSRNEQIEVTYLIDISGTDKLSTLSDSLREKFPSIGITFLDQNHMPGI